MEKRFKKDISSLNSIFEFADEFANKYKLDHAHLFSLNLVVEELFTNMVKYNPDNTNDVLIELEKKNKDMIIALTDFDARPFDITKRPTLNLSQYLEERRVGGLGIHLVKQMVDKIEYEYKDSCSKIILTKHLEN